MRSLNQRSRNTLFQLSRLGLVIVITIGLGIGWKPLLSQAENETIPAVVSSCIPQQTRQPIVRSELIGSTAFQEQQYYLLATYTADTPRSIDLVIALRGDRCEEVFFNPMGDPVPLASAVPQSVAQQLTLARYRRIVDGIGKDALQEQVNRSAASITNPVWFAEEVWALQQLGITIPDNVQIQP